MTELERHRFSELEAEIAAPPVVLQGNLVVPPGARGVVLFAHGGGGSRYSPHNKAVAEQLQEAGFATLLVDLITGEEEAADAQGVLHFDIGLLARRLAAASDWLRREPVTRGLRIGYFGASTGAAAALVAAAERPGDVAALVARDGRPELAGLALGVVRAATLLIVSGGDELSLELIRAALAEIEAEKDLAVLPGSGPRFGEPGELAEVARLAAGWFTRFLSRLELAH